MKTPKIVTRQSFNELISRKDEVGRYAIGKALVHLFNRQTEAEKSANTTMRTNNEGFTQADARSGSISARYFLKHGTLEDWQVRMWLKKNKQGNTRLGKYWEQINEEAAKKTQKTIAPSWAAEYEQLKMEYTMSIDSDDERIIKPHAYRLREFEKAHGITQPYIIVGAVA